MRTIAAGQNDECHFRDLREDAVAAAEPAGTQRPPSPQRILYVPCFRELGDLCAVRRRARCSHRPRPRSTRGAASGHRPDRVDRGQAAHSVARQNVAWLLDNQSSCRHLVVGRSTRLDAHVQTSLLALPQHSVRPRPAYDRDRDCPRQPGVGGGLAQRSLARLRGRSHPLPRGTPWPTSRSIAPTGRRRSSSLVHFVGDLHQPFHALGVGRGGNDVHRPGVRRQPIAEVTQRDRPPATCMRSWTAG